MEVTQLDADSLEEAADNPNHMDEGKFLKLVSTIEEHGFLEPVLVAPKGDGKFIIVSGHHRVRAAKQAGLVSVPAIIKQLTDQQRKMLQISFNRIKGDLNQAEVAQIFSELIDQGVDPGRLEMCGYTSIEVDALIAAAQQSVDEEMPRAFDAPQEDEAPPDIGTFILDVDFDSKKDLQRAKRALKRLAGKGAPLGAGLLRLIDADEEVADAAAG